MRSTTIIGPEQTGQGVGWQPGGRIEAWFLPSSERQRASEAARLRLANRPKWRMRTRPFGRT